MNRTARLDGTNANDVASPTHVRAPWGITKNELLAMREQGMTNAAIARSINSKTSVIDREIGKTPVELNREAQRQAGYKNIKKAHAAAHSKLEDKTETQENASDGVIASAQRLARKITSVRLEGRVADYHALKDHSAIDITKKEKGQRLSMTGLQGTVKFEHLEMLVEELMEVLDVAKGS